MLGLVMWAYGRSAVRCRIRPNQQYSVGVRSRRSAAAGALVFFDGLGHVGLYIGGGQIRARTALR